MSDIIQSTLVNGYCIDTSALIDMWRVNHPPDVFKKLWQEDIENIIQQGLLIAPKQVLEELKRKDDELTKWGKVHSIMFNTLDIAQTNQAFIVLSKFPNLIDKNKAIPDADPFVIGLAKSKDWTVITSERATGNIDKPHIPDVCKSFNVRCIKPIDLFREQKWEYP